MPIWRCPHCATPQAETDRCWVCRRSSTSCATCRHFRRSVAARLNYCALDARRLPIVGDEIRPCWEEGHSAEPGGRVRSMQDPDPQAPPGLDFVALEPRPEVPPQPQRNIEGAGGLWAEFD